MKFIAEIDVMPQEALLDPQGKAILNVLHNLNYDSVEKVRMGKHIKLIINSETEEEAKKQVEEICQKVLINPVVEQYSFVLKQEE